MQSITTWLTIASLVIAPLAAHAASFTPLGLGTSATSVSADGTTVVGSVYLGSGPSRAFVWNAVNGLRELGDLPGEVSSKQAWDVSSDGSIVVGYSSTLAGRGQEPFVWDAVRGMQRLVLPAGSIDGGANAISADGSVIVGNDGWQPPSQALLWDENLGLRPLGDLPGSEFSSMALDVSADGSVVVGFGTSDEQELPFYAASQAFIWDAVNGMRGLGGLPGQPAYSSANAVSGDGSIVVGDAQVGFSSLGFAWSEAFIWDAQNGMRSLGRPFLSRSSHAADVSYDGSTVVGRTVGISGGLDAFIWDESNGIRHLGDYLTTLGIDLGSWRLEWASGISADGLSIVGVGTNPSGQREAWIAVIPEPTTALLLGLGLAGLALKPLAR